MKVVVDTGNHIAALAAKLAKPDVVAAYPITPQTTIVEKIAEYVAKGEFSGDYICVESEHSAMSACIGASAAGARTFTATSAHGLLLMHEMLHWAALARLPIVMVNVNRAIGPGWTIWSDQNDSMAQRDTGWIQIYCSSNQEIFDSIIQAFKLAEHKDVQLPVMVCYDGFILSHTSMPVKVPEQKEIDDFLPKREPTWVLGQLDMTKLEEPAYNETIWETTRACAYPSNNVNIIVNAEWKDSADPAVIEFLTNYETTTAQANAVLAYMNTEDADVEAAAIYFLQEYETVWTSWVPADVAAKVKDALP